MGFLTGKTDENGRQQKINAYNILVLFLLAPSSIAYGYTGAIIGTTLGQPSFLEKFLGLNPKTGTLMPGADALIGATGGAYFAGATLGPLILPWISDRFGRRWAIAISNALNVISAAFMAGSVTIGEFIAFRFVAGASAFMQLGAVPLLMNEVVPSRMRGGLVELHAIFFIFGFAMASWIGFGFSFWTSSVDAWRIPLAIQGFWSLFGIVTLYWIPESPRWLMLNGREEEAKAILHRLHSDKTDPNHDFATAEVYQIQKQIAIDRTLDSSWLSLFRKPSYRKRVLMACGLTFFIQSSGDLVINNYGPLLYKALGFDTTKQLLYASAWLTWTLGLSVIALPIMDRVPRNKLTACGLWCCMSTLIVEAALVATYAEAGTNHSALQAAVAMFFLFQIGDTIMLNGPEWAYLGEIFPTHIRSKGYMLAMSILGLANVVYTQAAPTAFAAKNGWAFYILFIALTFIGGIVVWVWYPDTRHMPLEELAALFGDEADVAIYQAEIEIDDAHHVVDHHDEKHGAVHNEKTGIDV